MKRFLMFASRIYAFGRSSLVRGLPSVIGFGIIPAGVRNLGRITKNDRSQSPQDPLAKFTGYR
jgi:hypothetical protein